MKKFIAVLMTLCMLTALAACGNSAKEAETGSEDEVGKVVTGVEAIDVIGEDGIDWNHMSMDELYEMAKKEGGTRTPPASTSGTSTPISSSNTSPATPIRSCRRSAWRPRAAPPWPTCSW